MARYIYHGTFKDQNGAVVGSSTTSDGNPGTVTVYLAGTSTLASIYTASAGGVAVNSVTTDAYGYFYFWVDDGDYSYGQLFKLVLTHPDFITRTYDNIDIIYPSVAYLSSNLTFTQSGTGAVSRTAESKMREEVSVTDFGASGAASGATNLAAFKLAVAAVSAGGKLVVPVQTSAYSIDTSGGLSTAIEIDKAIEVEIHGEIKQAAQGTTVEANPEYIFSVTSDNVTFSGSGTISGHGETNDVNIVGVLTTSPGLISVTGNNFKIHGLTIDTPPKIGILLNGTYHTIITNCTFTGGPTAYSDTSYFYVAINAGYDVVMSKCNFYPDSGGGMGVNCVFANGCYESVFSDNICISPWEKLIYIYGSRNLVTGNYVENGYITSAFRFSGDYNKISDNVVNGYGANDDGLGCYINDGIYNEVTNNQFIGGTQGGIAVSLLEGSYSGGFSGTKIIGNTIVGSGSATANGIQLDFDGADSAGILVQNNIIINTADTATEAGIWIYGGSGQQILDMVVSGNIINSAYNGIHLQNVNNSTIQGNIISSINASGFGIKSTASSRNRIANNVIRNGGSYALYETSSSTYNQYILNKNYGATNPGVSGLDATSFEIGTQNGDTSLKSAHIADVGAGYTSGQLDSEGEVITAMNAHGTAINAILAALENFGILKTA